MGRIIFYVIKYSHFPIAASLALTIVLGLCFPLLEPKISQAIVSQFTVRQQITSEISFLATSTNVIMVGSIAGVTGGTATGTTRTVVQTNSSGGYTMDIAFAGSPAMLGDLGGTGIRNFGTTSQPVVNFAASTSAVFGFTVLASTTTDVDQSFLFNAGSCNQVGGTTSTSSPTCWMNPTTTNFRVINRTTAANTGATTTLVFKVVVPNNPSPAVNSDFYTATATLTVLTQ